MVFDALRLRKPRKFLRNSRMDFFLLRLTRQCRPMSKSERGHGDTSFLLAARSPQVSLGAASRLASPISNVRGCLASQMTYQTQRYNYSSIAQYSSAQLFTRCRTKIEMWCKYWFSRHFIYKGFIKLIPIQR